MNDYKSESHFTQILPPPFPPPPHHALIDYPVPFRSSEGG